MNTQTVATATATFIATAQKLMDEYYTKGFPTLEKPTLVFETARKYIKVWESKGGFAKSCIYAFINKETGEIFMPASYTKPADAHARGNVLSDRNGVEALGWDGRSIRYHGSPSYQG